MKQFGHDTCIYCLEDKYHDPTCVLANFQHVQDPLLIRRSAVINERFAHTWFVL